MTHVQPAVVIEALDTPPLKIIHVQTPPLPSYDVGRRQRCDVKQMSKMFCIRFPEQTMQV